MTESISISNSQVKTHRRCPQQWAYKYLERLQAKDRKRAPHLGNWLHRALETHYLEGDWKIGHKEYLKDWNSLYEEEREVLSEKFGPLPKAVRRIIRSYLWWWKHDGWKVLAVEHEFEVLLGSFTHNDVKILVYANGKADLVVEDDEGNRWVVDHKSTGSIPQQSAFHAMDPQLMLYPVGLKEEFGDFAGIVYNYIRSRPPSIPQLTKKTGQISRRKIVTDYPTARKFLIDNGYDPKDFTDWLKQVKKNQPQLMRRYRLPREKRVTQVIMKDFIATGKEIYLEKDKTRHVRNITKDCATMCEYHDICRGELNGFDMSHLKRARFTIRESRSNGAEPNEEL